MEGRNESIQIMFPSLTTVFGAGAWTPQNSYEALGADGLVFTASIDLSGWSMQDFTFGTVQAQFQDPGVYSALTASGRVEIVEIISSVPMSVEELTVIKDNLGTTVPGMLGSAENFTAIIYGNYRLYVPNAALVAFPGFLQLISTGSFGSNEPTASSELYCYRIIKCAGAIAETLATPACRIGLFGAFFKEGDLEYMMRLKRSYELQQL